MTNACFSSNGANLNTLTWQQQKCLVIPPTNAATMKVQLWLVAAGGWPWDSPIRPLRLRTPFPTWYTTAERLFGR